MLEEGVELSSRGFGSGFMGGRRCCGAVRSVGGSEKVCARGDEVWRGAKGEGVGASEDQKNDHFSSVMDHLIGLKFCFLELNKKGNKKDLKSRRRPALT